MVATDADLTRAQAQKLAGTAHDGIARAVRPVHLLNDGDTVFALATGPARSTGHPLALNEVLAAGADVVTRAIVRAVLAARSVTGQAALSLLQGAVRARTTRRPKRGLTYYVRELRRARAARGTFACEPLVFRNLVTSRRTLPSDRVAWRVASASERATIFRIPFQGPFGRSSSRAALLSVRPGSCQPSRRSSPAGARASADRHRAFHRRATRFA